MSRRATKTARPVPSQFMRRRRPELFSDTTGEPLPRVDRSTLEWWLGSLTARNQQHDFEVFCRRLAERELCPNWRPLTGPTGGGDSKADAATYPVAPEIAERWFEATPPPTSERWALAISAKADWKAKVRSDVASLANTALAPARVYFLTNQYVKDKTRDDVERELSQKHALHVEILDLAWISARVCDHRNDDLAIECLHVSATHHASQPGPNDRRRTDEVRAIEDRLKNSTTSSHPTRVHLMDDFLRIAELEAQLGKPRNSVEQRLARAQQIAEEVGAQPNIRRVLYQRAWILHWWYDDTAGANQALDEWLRHTDEIDDAWELQQISNLWHLRLGNSTKPRAKTVWSAHKRIVACADRLASEKARPNNALHASIIGDTLRLQAALHSKTDTADIIDRLTQAFAESRGLVLVPLVALSEPLVEMDSAGIFDDDQHYEALFTVLIDLQKDRAGELKSGRAYARRGYRFLQEKNYQRALSCLGRARVLLATHESVDDLVHVMFAVGCVYEVLDCPWAAHSEYVHALALALQRAHRQVPSPIAVQILLRLASLEVLAGRPTCVFMWVETLSAVAAIVGRQADIQQEVAHLDSALGALFLRADCRGLEPASTLCACLDALQLWGSRMVLLYALGHVPEAREEGLLPDRDERELADVLRRFAFSEDAEQLADMSLLMSPRERLTTVILGSSVVVTFPNSLAGTGIAQGVLAFLEAVFVSLVKRQATLTAALLTINIREAAHDSDSVESSIDERDLAMIDLTLGGHFFRDGGVNLSSVAVGNLRVALVELLTGRFAMWSSGALGELLEGDSVGDRAFAIGLPTASLDWLAARERMRFEHWSSREGHRPLTRTTEWWLDGGGSRPAARRREEVFVDLMDIRRWREAGYRGVAFLVPQVPPDHPADGPTPPPPAMGFLFDNALPAGLLFSGWRAQLGEEDTENAIDVTIVEEVESDGSYAVIVSPGDEYLRRLGHRSVLSQSTCQICKPTSGMLSLFKIEYSRSRTYSLMPFVPGDNGLTMAPGLAIRKRHLTLLRYPDLPADDMRRMIVERAGPTTSGPRDGDRQTARREAYAARLEAERVRRGSARGRKRSARK